MPKGILYEKYFNDFSPTGGVVRNGLTCVGVRGSATRRQSFDGVPIVSAAFHRERWSRLGGGGGEFRYVAVETIDAARINASVESRESGEWGCSALNYYYFFFQYR